MSIETFTKSQFYKNKSPNLIKLGFDFRKDVSQEYLKIQSMIYSRYHISNESMLTIMKEFGIPSSRTMDIIFRLFDIEPRSFSESQTIALDVGRKIQPSSYVYKNIYHTSWTGEVFCLRSSYEENYAKLLDQQKIKYLVEALRIKYFHTGQNKYRIAIPDFYLPDDNLIVEVKSNYWLDREEMICKKNSYELLGYKFKLLLEGEFIELVGPEGTDPSFTV